MIRWKINKKKSEITVRYECSPLLSYKAQGLPKDPVIDRKLVVSVEIEIVNLMDIVEHKKSLLRWWNNDFVIKEMLGL